MLWRIILALADNGKSPHCLKRGLAKHVIEKPIVLFPQSQIRCSSLIYSNAHFLRSCRWLSNRYSPRADNGTF